MDAFVQGHRTAATAPVDLALRAGFNPELNKAWCGAVMEVINQVTMLSIILSKVWSMALVVLVVTGLSLAGVVRGLLAVPVGGSTTLFLAGTALHLFDTTSMGIFLATVARSMPQFGMLAQAILYRGAGLAVVWPQFIALAGIGAALFVPSLARFRNTLGALT